VAIGKCAEQNNAILVTKDCGFVPAGKVNTSPQVVWVRTGNIANRILFERVDARWRQVMAHLSGGASIVEFRQLEHDAIVNERKHGP